MKRCDLALVAILLAMTAPLSAMAQTSPLIIDQNRADRVAPAAPTTTAQAPAGAVIQHADVVAPFILRGVQFDGGEALPASIKAAARPYIGQRMSKSRLNAMADALAADIGKLDVALYTVILPNQTFSNGWVHLRIVEGHIADVQVTGEGAARKDIGRVRALASRLILERPLRRSSLERSLSLIRDLPGIQADVQMQRVGSPGAVRLMIALKQKPFSAAVGINDRGTAELGKTQIDLGLTFNGLFRSGDKTQLTIAFPTDVKRFQYYALSQSEPIGDQGLTATANVGYLTTRPASVPIHGSAVTGGLQLSYPLVRRYTETFYVSGSLDGVDSDNALFGQRLSDERTRALRIAAAYTESWPKTTLTGSMTGSFGLDALGARVNANFSDKDFRKLNVQGSVDQQLSPRWIVRVKAEAQFSADRLPATEQLALGGPDFGRAFESAIIEGDHGLAGSAELAWRPSGMPFKLKNVELYSFVDAGQLRRAERPGLPGATYALASTGLGTRIPIFDRTILELETDRALSTPYGEHEKDWRLVFGFKTIV